MKKKLIILAVILLIQGVVSYIIIVNYMESPINMSGVAKMFEGSDDGGEEPEKLGEIYLVEDMVVNPSDSKGRRFVALSLGLEAAEGVSADALKEREPLINAAVVSLLAMKPLDEFINVEYRDSLRQQMYESIANTLPENMIKRIYITKFIIQ